MAPWYEEAEFYHIYPIGLTGAPRKNESEETVPVSYTHLRAHET